MSRKDIVIDYPEPTMYPSTVEASMNGRQVLAVVPSAVGLTNAVANEATKTAPHAQNSNVAKGDGLPIGSAAMSSVLTIFLTVSAVYPATVSEANQPATADEEK
jgi:hypothetical protein